MTASEFNEKYKDYLEKGHYGLDIDNPTIIAYLDDLFEQTLTRIPDFKYQQIKIKWDCICFYSNAGFVMNHLIENELNYQLKHYEEVKKLEQEDKKCDSN